MAHCRHQILVRETAVAYRGPQNTHISTCSPCVKPNNKTHSSTDISPSDHSSCLLTDATTLLYLHHHYRALISFQNSCIWSLLMRDSQQCFLTTCSAEWDSLFLSYLSFLFCPDWYCDCRKISCGHGVHTLQNWYKVGVGTSRQFNTPHNAFDLI